MAVEIPVFIDIDKAFAEAAAAAPKAMKPLETSIDKLNDRLTKAYESLNKYKIGSKNWEKAAKEIQLVSQALAAADAQFKRFSSNDGSIKQMSSDLAALRASWESMGAKQKFDRKGNLSAEAKQLIADYKRISAELEKSGKTLAQMEQEEKRLAEAAQRRADLTKKGAQARQYENAILNTNVKTIRVLQEQERILSARLSQAVIGSSKYNQLKTQLEAVRAEMQKTIGTSNNLAGSLNRQVGVVGRLATQFASYISIYSLLRFAKQIRDVTGELEYQRVALGHLIQDEEYGAELFERIKAAAIESPFRIKDLVTYTKQLAAYRVEQEELFSVMMRLADVSAGLGVDMNRLILAYGQVRAASVLRGQELRQFTEAGIPLVELLAEKFTELNGRVVKTSEVFELISKRAVPFSMIAEIFEDLTDKGGMFYEMQERQAATLTGRWEKLKDAFDIGLQSVGNTKTFEVYNNVILATLNAIAKHLNVLPKLIEGVSAAWLIYTVATTKSRIATRRAAMAEIEEATAKEAQSIANIKGIKNVDAYTRALLRQKTATNALTRGFWKLWAAVVASPVAAAVAAVGAIAAALFLFKKRTDEAANSFHEFDALIEDTSTGLKDVARYDKLIDRYERLASKTELTDKEHQRLYQTMSLLQEKFPEVGVGIDNESDALDKQLESLRKLNAEREKEVRLRGEGELDAARVRLREAEQKRDQLYRERLRKQNRSASLQSEMQLNDLYKDNPDWKKAQKRIGEINQELAEQDKLIEGLQKRIVSLNRILHPEQADPFTGWKKQIQDMRDLTVGDVTSPIFTDDEIEKWGTLDEALADIAKRKKVVKEREDALTESIKGQTGEIREQIQADLDWAQAERVRLESMEAFFSSYSSYGQDLLDNFASLLLRSYDEGVFKRLGEEMKQMFPQSNADLLARPMVDAAKLVEKGWQDAGEGIATVFSSVYDWEDDKGGKHNIMVTPILPDGSVLSPDELDEYVKRVIADSEHKDEKHLVIGIDVEENAGEKLHEMQEQFYNLKQIRESMAGKKPEEYLITDKELRAVEDVVDMIDLIDKKMSAIEKEIEKVSKIKLDSNISEEAKQDAADYLRNLQSIYDMLALLKGRYEDELSDLAKEVQGLFPNLMESAFKGVDKGTFSKLGLFSDKDLKNVTTVVDLYGLWSQKINAVTKEIENYSKKMSESISEEQRQKILDTIQSLTDEKELLEEMGKVFGFLLKTTGGGGYQQDPWILIYKNRTKFVQDFRNSVEDLNKYLAESDSIQKTRGIMEGRGKSLGFDVSQMTGSRQEVLDWYDKTIGEITEKIQKLGGRAWAGLGVQAILAKDTKSRTIKAWQDLLADVFKERTDFDLSQQKDDFERAFEKMKDELKRSETARNFYQDILDTTGDEEMAESLTISVYGDIGQDFKDRIQAQLDEAFKALDADKATEEMKKAIEGQDFGYILDHLDAWGIESKWAKTLKEMALDTQKFNADIIKGYSKLLMEYNDAEQERVNITKTAAQKRKTIELGVAAEISALKKKGATQEEIEEAHFRASSAINAINRQEEKDLYKLGEKYRLFFNSVGVISRQSAREVATKMKEMLTDQFANGEITLAKYKRELKEVEEQLEKYNFGAKKLEDVLSKDIFENMSNLLSQYSDNLLSLSSVVKTEGGVWTPPAEAKSFLKNIDRVLNAGNFSRIFKKGAKISIETKVNTAAQEAYNKIFQETGSAKEAESAATAAASKELSNFSSEMGEASGSVANFASAIVIIYKMFNSFASMLDEIQEDEMRSTGDYSKSSQGGVINVNGVEMQVEGLTVRRVSDALGSVSTAFQKFLSLDIFGGFKEIWEGFSGVKTRVRDANDQIKVQQQTLKRLEIQYGRLESAIQDAFGTDYIENFNQQILVLQAEAEAYRAQAAAERSKGKKADEYAAQDYEAAAEEIENKILEMQNQISEFMSGTDVTSAAKSFAEAWVEAYKSFGNTTGAIKEKFKEMIDNMVINSLAAAIIQKQLQPIFDMIDDLSHEGKELSEKDIATIAAETEKKTELINAELTALMQNLAAAGVNMRGSGSSLSGIAKDLAGASEQSINGLAAGINTQNFYMSYMPTISANVEAILAALTGDAAGTAARRAAAASTQSENVVSSFGDETFRKQMERMDQNIADLCYLIRSVRTGRGTNTNTHYIATK